MMEIMLKCRECGKEVYLNVNIKDLGDFTSGKKLVQDAFPYLSEGDREMFVSGICSDCFDKLMKEENYD